ncbi:hypothetical protein SMALA_0740 [Streptomyces malaysiensis subsp. malaysiensis]|nr:hypothetical protein SMALA_0740 [Streptomyces malaysiensis]
MVLRCGAGLGRQKVFEYDVHRLTDGIRIQAAGAERGCGHATDSSTSKCRNPLINEKKQERGNPCFVWKRWIADRAECGTMKADAGRYRRPMAEVPNAPRRARVVQTLREPWGRRGRVISAHGIRAGRQWGPGGRGTRVDIIVSMDARCARAHSITSTYSP